MTANRTKLVVLSARLGTDCWLVYDTAAPLSWSVWADGDILGAANTRECAIREARAQVAEWAVAS
jgi:hypothetical protein